MCETMADFCFWKQCGNGGPDFVTTPIMIQNVASDGITLQGSATKILDNNGASDGGVVEAPTLTKTGSTWVRY